LAWNEPNGTYSPLGINTEAALENGRFVLSGTKLFVPDANVANTILCAVRTDRSRKNEEEGISLFIIDGKPSGLSVELLNTLAGDKQCEVVLDEVTVFKEALLGELDQGWRYLKEVLKKAAVVKAAEMSGGAQRVLEMTVNHAKNRVQFDRPIGSFQAVQHQCADMFTFVDSCTFMTYQAAWRITKGLPFGKEVSMCKAWVSDCYRKLVSLAHQIMGGTGFMEETDLQLYFKNAKTAELAFGDANFHREMVARELGL
jgi:alkylation response protein AidB-like acyl-CoA dehydrogenase